VKPKLVVVKTEDFLAATEFDGQANKLMQRLDAARIAQANEDFDVLRRYAIFFSLAERAEGYSVAEDSMEIEPLAVLLATGIVQEVKAKEGERRFVRRTARVAQLEESLARALAELRRVQAKFEEGEGP
jgi:hypothetical protein